MGVTEPTPLLLPQLEQPTPKIAKNNPQPAFTSYYNGTKGTLSTRSDLT